MKREAPAIELAPDYYLDNFLRLIEHAHEWYVDLLTEQERDWITTFLSLNHDAQCLLVRLLSRKGEWFRSDKLNYAEIGDINGELHALQAAGLVVLNPHIDEATLSQTLLTKPEILARHPTLSRSDRKEQWLATLQQKQEAGLLAQMPAYPFILIRLLNAEIIEVLLVLFFGNARQDLSQFVLEDLGLNRFEPYTLSRERRFFTERKSLEELRVIAQIQHQYWLLNKPTLTSITSLVNMIPSKASHRHVERKRQRVINLLARELERCGEYQQALYWFSQSELVPSRERRARIHDKLGDIAEYENIVTDMLIDPQDQQELEVAQRLHQKVIRYRGGKVTRAAKPAYKERHIELDLTQCRVELAVKAYLEQQGYRVYYLENHFLNTLLGLTLWPALFAPIEGSFINRYQHRPLDLYHEDFVDKRQELIDQSLQALKEQGVLSLMTRWQEKWGTSNPFIYWAGFDDTLFELVEQAISRDILIELMLVQLKDLRLFKSGMPDLIAFKDGKYEWIEVKGPGDKLQESQWRWIRIFKQLQIPFSVCHVSAKND
ncbi:VRR-NUC domain-containing protein [Vibrio nitrifigilis]|uniref:phosphodiesterase I n=1 Tax=Vibrio nitrifigilis TaxID=2789781 RepID=A0ABS0GJ67_9VIBR|nr:VRR-NUC domain-containing protein [Vibrio nitrifigilis]MBF9002478.1 VRR-NUC domain-containing protein [Vibrio nitrifigilis]